jgi:hypothetical protein
MPSIQKDPVLGYVFFIMNKEKFKHILYEMHKCAIACTKHSNMQKTKRYSMPPATIDDSSRTTGSSENIYQYIGG